MRYINVQQHASSCGPIAIINALKYIGRTASYKSEMEYFKSIKEFDSHGMWPDALSRVLIKRSIKHKYYVIESVLDMEKILDKGNPIILNCLITTEKAHYIFIISHSPHIFRAYNIEENTSLWKKTMAWNIENLNKSKYKITAWEILKDSEYTNKGFRI